MFDITRSLVVILQNESKLPLCSKFLSNKNTVKIKREAYRKLIFSSHCIDCRFKIFETIDKKK